jgi:TetR/AcrR family transcriptional repressor of nem operon
MNSTRRRSGSSCKRAPAAWQKGRERIAVTTPRAQRIVDAYFSREHLDDRDDCCPLIGTASDVQRGGGAVKAAYQEVVEQLVKVFEDHLNEPQDSDLSVPASHDRTLARRSEAVEAKDVD